MGLDGWTGGGAIGCCEAPLITVTACGSAFADVEPSWDLCHSQNTVPQPMITAANATTEAVSFRALIADAIEYRWRTRHQAKSRELHPTPGRDRLGITSTDEKRGPRRSSGRTS